MRFYGGARARVAVFTVACTALAACGQQNKALWLKPGSGTDEFTQSRYACLQQSQQQSSSAYIGRYGGAASSEMITNGGLYDACMNSRGWVYTPISDVAAFSETLKPIGEELKAGCSREDLRILFRSKMNCRPLEATPEQYADRFKISRDEKVALVKWVEIAQSGNEKIAAAYRQFAGKKGDAVASVIENASLEGKRTADEFANGAYTWGEYNRRRAELAKRMQEEQKAALTY